MKFHRLAGATALALLLAACGGGGDGGIGGTGSPTGTMKVSVTDAPSCGYNAVNVTIEKVRVHQSASAPEAGSGWSEIVLNPPQRVDLLTLTNGVLFPLGETALPAGKYEQMRLVLAENSQARPLANSVVPTGGTETPLDTPSAQQSGLKMNMNVDVPAGEVVDVVLDFDACKSVVKRGNTGRYNLKPVITVIPLVNAGGMRVEGWVDPTMAGGTVTLQAQGVPVKTTFADTTGRFALFPVPAGTYDLVVVANGRATVVMTGVPVVDTSVTGIGSTSVRLVPPVSLMQTVTGTVQPETATVRATQALTGGPTIEVASPAVDGLDGSFEMALPLEAPRKTTYAANASSFTLTPDTPVAGDYTVAATSNNVTKTQIIDVTAPVLPLTFTFP